MQRERNVHTGEVDNAKTQLTYETYKELCEKTLTNRVDVLQSEDSEGDSSENDELIDMNRREAKRVQSTISNKTLI